MSSKDELSRRLRSSIRRISLEFRLLISAPTSGASADFSRSRGRRRTLTGPVSHHFLQAKPSTTLLTHTLNPHHRAGESRARYRLPTLHHLAQVGVHPLGQDLIPPKVSYPGHFTARPLGTDPGCVPFRFEIQFLYTHGSAQVGFSPFYIFRLSTIRFRLTR